MIIDARLCFVNICECMGFSVHWYVNRAAVFIAKVCKHAVEISALQEHIAAIFAFLYLDAKEEVGLPKRLTLQAFIELIFEMLIDIKRLHNNKEVINIYASYNARLIGSRNVLYIDSVVALHGDEVYALELFL
jgi:hypothetical protein